MRTRIPFVLLAATIASSLFSVSAHARARVFVASYGDDNNPCTFGSPCKTFQHAHDVVDASGEVTAIDSAGFGPINITKAVTITSPDGVEAGIVPAAFGTAITINAGTNDAIVLRGLTLNGSGIADTGINFGSGASLTVTNCVIQNFIDQAILFGPHSASDLVVSNTLLLDNGTYGIQVGGGAVTITVAIDHVQASNNGVGGFLLNELTSGSITATISDSVAANNNVGVDVDAQFATGTVKATLFHSVITNNTVGIQAIGGSAISTLTVAQSTVTGNATSWFVGPPGVIRSYQDNYFNDNGTNNGSLTSITKQ